MQNDSILGLGSIRRSRGISLKQISETTKIGLWHLKAIEQGDFKKLPGGIYNISYIRQYARAISLDDCELLAYYHCHIRPDLPEPPFQAVRRTRGLWGWLISKAGLYYHLFWKQAANRPSSP